MKPHRLKLAHHLLLSYNLYREMDVYRPHLATSTVSFLSAPPYPPLPPFYIFLEKYFHAVCGLLLLLLLWWRLLLLSPPSGC